MAYHDGEDKAISIDINLNQDQAKTQADEESMIRRMDDSLVPLGNKERRTSLSNKKKRKSKTGRSNVSATCSHVFCLTMYCLYVIRAN